MAQAENAVVECQDCVCIVEYAVSEHLYIDVQPARQQQGVDGLTGS